MPRRIRWSLTIGWASKNAGSVLKSTRPQTGVRYQLSNSRDRGLPHDCLLRVQSAMECEQRHRLRRLRILPCLPPARFCVAVRRRSAWMKSAEALHTVSNFPGGGTPLDQPGIKLDSIVNFGLHLGIMELSPPQRRSADMLFARANTDAAAHDFVESAGCSDRKLLLVKRPPRCRSAKLFWLGSERSAWRFSRPT